MTSELNRMEIDMPHAISETLLWITTALDALYLGHPRLSLN